MRKIITRCRYVISESYNNAKHVSLLAGKMIIAISDTPDIYVNLQRETDKDTLKIAKKLWEPLTPKLDHRQLEYFK